MEQWQFGVTAGGRIWYGIDDTTRTLWITQAGTAHPRQTDRDKHGIDLRCTCQDEPARTG